MCSRRTALVGFSISSCAFICIPGLSPAVEGANAALLLLRAPFVQELRLSVSLFVSPAFRRLRFVWRSAFRVQCVFSLYVVFSLGFSGWFFQAFFHLGFQRCKGVAPFRHAVRIPGAVFFRLGSVFSVGFSGWFFQAFFHLGFQRRKGVTIL